MNTPIASKRTLLLQAASRIILHAGVERLTLEAVAREASVSKGGLLYHFPSKEALVVGLIEQLLDHFELALQAEFDSDQTPAAPGRWLRAYVRATLAEADASNSVSAGLLAAVTTNPALLAPLHQRFAEWQKRTEHDGLDPAHATIIRLAVDGWWLTELCGFAPLAEPLRTQLRERLLALTQENAESITQG